MLNYSEFDWFSVGGNLLAKCDISIQRQTARLLVRAGERVSKHQNKAWHTDIQVVIPCDVRIQNERQIKLFLTEQKKDLLRQQGGCQGEAKAGVFIVGVPHFTARATWLAKKQVMGK